MLITLNAANQLEAALQSLQFCDELVVVDSGSTDNTLAIAQQHGARIVQQAWLGFGPQKQFAVGLAQYDWVLCLDADERISSELEHSIRNVFAAPTPPPFAGYDLPRCNYFLGRYLRHGEGYPDYSRRLFNRLHARWSNDPVHEKVEGLPTALFAKLKGDIVHESAETLHGYLHKQNRYTTLQANELAKQNKWPRTHTLLFSPLFRFVKFYLVRQGFRDGWQGFIHITIGCINSFMKYAKTRERIMKLRS